MTPITSATPALAPRRAAGPAPAPRQPLRARGGDPLPGFPDARAYQNYVINLVAQARQLEREIETATKVAGDKPDATGLALRERLDAVKLQLKLLRDDFPIPAAWTRWRMLGGEGFDKDAFWREQVEAIPGKPVVVSPEPPKPAARPAAPQPAAAPAAPLPTVALPVQPADARVDQLLRLALAAHQGGLSSTASDGFGKAIAASPTPADAMAVFQAAHQKGYSNSASSAVARAVSLSGDSATSLAIALAAHQKGYGATPAFALATRQAPGQAAALQVALAAHQKGYSNAASEAFKRATQLSTTSAEALQVGENARLKGYNSSAAAAMKRAMELP